MATIYTKTDGNKNFAGLCRIYVEPCRDLMWKVLIQNVSIPNLIVEIQKILASAHRCLPFHHQFKRLVDIYSSKGKIEKTDCDISVLYSLFRNIPTGLQPPTRGWGPTPRVGDHRITDDVERIHLGRNTVTGHPGTFSISDAEFTAQLTDMVAIVTRIDSSFVPHLNEIELDCLYSKGHLQHYHIYTEELERQKKFEAELKKRVDDNTRRLDDHDAIHFAAEQKRRDEYQEQGEVSGAGPVSSGRDETTRLLLQGQNLLISTESLRMGELLGKGHFGSVFKGYLTLEEEKGETLVAVKTLHKDSPREIDVQAFTKEALIMKDFNNPNVLSLMGICLGIDDMPLVVLPFIKHGDLLSYIRDDTHNPTIKDLINFAIDIAEGMAYLSSLKFVHRDLAARNCMLDEEYRVKVADFGLSRDIYEKDYYTCDNKKTKLPVKWMAIESLEKGKYSTKSDVWSYGIVLWELLTRGVNPYPEVDNWDIVLYLKQGRRMPRPHYCPDPLYTIMRKCWMPNSHGRPTFADLVHEIRDMITMLEQAMGQGNDSANIQSTYVNMEKCTDYHYTEMLMPPPDSESERTSPASGPASPFRHSSTPSMEPDSSNPLSARVNKGRQCKEEEEMEERRMSAMEEADPQTGPQQTHREPSSSNLPAQTFLQEYSMTRKPRGICVIINNKNFEKDKPRTGTDVDRDGLETIFKKLGFIVQIHDDLTDTKMMETLIDATNIDHTNFDCFVCCILTYGNIGYLLGSNNNPVSIKELTSKFQVNRCSSLAGKPKLFFFEAGQGCVGMERAEIETDCIQNRVERDGENQYIPPEADFLLGYATVPGYASFRNIIRGSWYITKLVQMLDEHSHNQDLLSILIKVTEEVSNVEGHARGHICKQIPAPSFTLRKKLYFR